ncbi:MAG: PEGA domain-containing protein [Patescibacteria group bacterium]
MNDRRTKNFTRIVISQLAVASLMFAIGLVIVFYAQGFRYDWQKMTLIKTGILYLSSNQKNASVYLDDQFVSAKTPYSRNLLPGYYQIEVKKDNYVAWLAVAKIEPEMVTDFRDVILIPNSITPAPLNDEKKIALLSLPTDVLAVNADKALVYNDHEIWVSDILVTRFAEPIQKAIWYPDYNHIIYQQGQKIRVIEKSGFNDTLLVKLNQSTVTDLAVGGRGEELYYRDNGQTMMAKIK